MTPERVTAARRLRDEDGLTFDQVAAAIGVSRATVVRALRASSTAREAGERGRSGDVGPGWPRSCWRSSTRDSPGYRTTWSDAGDVTFHRRT